MMPTIRIVLAAAMVLALPQVAPGQAQYSAKDVVSHFSAPSPAAAPACPEGTICLPKKGTRAVCIGTGSACAGQEPPAPASKAEGFDLLITFELGSDELSPQARANLQEFAKAMNDPALASAHFNVDGHTDARGSNAFNMTLSERRAEKVVQYLEQLGIDPSRLKPKGHGETEPRDPADPFAAINRRVEATISTQ